MKPILSISLLASRKKEEIRRCLDSLKPLMDVIPSELILVDTSEDKEVGQLLREYTDCVISFSWCNDFSKARNVGLKAAKGKWFLYLDDDEWFVETDELVHFFVSGEYKNYGYANYIQRNFFDPEYETYTDNWVSRMIRISPDTEFKSRIHEYLYPAYGPVKNLRAIVNHSGYIYMSEEDRKKRFRRNEPLLLQMMEEEPANIRWGIQLAQEYYSVGEWVSLEKLCKRVLSDKVFEGLMSTEHLICTFYAGSVEALLGQLRYEEALEAITHFKERESSNRLGLAYLYLLEGISYLQLSDGEKAYLPEAKHAVDAYLKLEKEITQDEAQYAIWQEALIVDGAFDTISKKKAYSILLADALFKKDTGAIEYYFSLLEWDKKAIYVLKPFLRMFMELAFSQCEAECIRNIWLGVWKKKEIYDLALEEGRELWRRKTPHERAKAKADYDRWVSSYLEQYYKKEVLREFSMLLPQFAQRALTMPNEIAEECV